MTMTRDHGPVLTYLKLKGCFRSSGTSHRGIRCRRKARVQSSGSEMLPVSRSQCWACPECTLSKGTFCLGGHMQNPMFPGLSW